MVITICCSMLDRKVVLARCSSRRSSKVPMHLADRAVHVKSFMSACNMAVDLVVMPKSSDAGWWPAPAHLHGILNTFRNAKCVLDCAQQYNLTTSQNGEKQSIRLHFGAQTSGYEVYNYMMSCALQKSPTSVYGSRLVPLLCSKDANYHRPVFCRLPGWYFAIQTTNITKATT